MSLARSPPITTTATRRSKRRGTRIIFENGLGTIGENMTLLCRLRSWAVPRTKKVWGDWVNQRFPDFPVILELCNGSKHFELDPKPKVQGYLQHGLIAVFSLIVARLGSMSLVFTSQSTTAASSLWWTS